MATVQQAILKNQPSAKDKLDLIPDAIKNKQVTEVKSSNAPTLTNSTALSAIGGLSGAEKSAVEGSILAPVSSITGISSSAAPIAAESFSTGITTKPSIQPTTSSSLTSRPFFPFFFPKFIIGTPRSDLLVGTGSTDIVLGLGGDDLIFGLGGNDILLGNDGNDVMFGGFGDDRMFGGRGNDYVFGDSGNDTIFGDSGNDVLFGDAGKDTVNYSTLGTAITLLPRGIIDKGRFGRDELVDVEKIVATPGKANTIDASSAGSGGSINVNLQKQSLQVNLARSSSLNLTVQNFVNVKGAALNDNITGDNKNNQLTGGAGSDEITGAGGNDTIVGVDPSSFKPGTKEIDILTGGSGRDKFVLGDSRNVYYQGGGIFGLNDYAFIEDFRSGQDKFQLKRGNYVFGRNFIAVQKGFIFNKFDSVAAGAARSSEPNVAQVENAVDNIIKGNNPDLSKVTTGVGAQISSAAWPTDNDSSSSRLIAPVQLDIIAITENRYNFSDIDFV
ncbi:calcium-binding protein [Moorena producens]|uniref:calcium-binding protein n=1 Tax=Moorena producens TaxID=1155739 RepID=UPI003C716EA7